MSFCDVLGGSTLVVEHLYSSSARKSLCCYLCLKNNNSRKIGNSSSSSKKCHTSLLSGLTSEPREIQCSPHGCDYVGLIGLPANDIANITTSPAWHPFLPAI